MDTEEQRQARKVLPFECQRATSMDPSQRQQQMTPLDQQRLQQKRGTNGRKKAMDTEEQRQARKEQESVNLERQDAERRGARLEQ